MLNTPSSVAPSAGRVGVGNPPVELALKTSPDDHLGSSVTTEESVYTTGLTESLEDNLLQVGGGQGSLSRGWRVWLPNHLVESTCSSSSARGTRISMLLHVSAASFLGSIFCTVNNYTKQRKCTVEPGNEAIIYVYMYAQVHGRVS